MKKILTMLIIGFLLLSAFGAAALTTIHRDDLNKTSVSNYVKFSPLSIDQDDSTQYLSVQLKDCSTFLATPGKPKLPKIVKTIELPFGVTDVTVKAKPIGLTTQQISKQIRPASSLIPLTAYDLSLTSYSRTKDAATYKSSTPYPNEWCTYTVKCGLNEDNEHVTFVTIDVYPIQYEPANNKIILADRTKLSINYQDPQGNPFPATKVHDLVIIAPEEFSSALQPLINHKIYFGIDTILKTTEEIYSEYSGRDEPEQIKYFIKDAVESWGVTYILLVGGLKSMIYAKPRDHFNYGSSGWYVPVRYTNMFDDPAFPLMAGSIFDPGVISDLYYADLYKDGGAFADWDPNGDGVFAALGKPGVDDDPTLDYIPDVVLSRLACRSIEEVNTVVNKIIVYESSKADPSWFERMVVVSGDGFLDQEDLNIQWDTNGLPDGSYTIFAQSSNPMDITGPTVSVEVTKDSSQESVITYSHDDNLIPEVQDALENGYPTVPIAEIVSISDGDILGNTDVAYEPTSNAYCNEFFFWANVSYVDGVLTIRGKSYDPKPYGNVSSIHVWIENDQGQTVFSDWRNDTEMYYEGEWTTGEKVLLGRGGALYYMPSDFEKEIIWTSNGGLKGIDDVLNAVSEGCGFLFFSGHGSPNVWADQCPGIPGDRGPAGVTGMQVTTLQPWPPFVSSPIFPMDEMSNQEKLPIAVVGGCHNSQFNVSMILGFYDILPYLFPSLPSKSMWCHGVPVPETFSWRLIRNPDGGAIASLGNTGLGYGMPGKELTTGGGDSWITIEIFKQYGAEGHDILGDAYKETLTSYVNNFDMTDLSAGHPKTITQWVLLGDPTLKIGGYD